jgi:hypothetical protein
MPSDLCVYLPRNPKISPYYQCVEDHFETFDQVYGKDRDGKDRDVYDFMRFLFW